MDTKCARTVTRSKSVHGFRRGFHRCRSGSFRGINWYHAGLAAFVSLGFADLTVAIQRISQGQIQLESIGLSSMVGPPFHPGLLAQVANET